MFSFHIHIHTVPLKYSLLILHPLVKDENVETTLLNTNYLTTKKLKQMQDFTHATDSLENCKEYQRTEHLRNAL